MALEMAVCRATTPAGNGTIDFTVSDFAPNGTETKAAIFILNFGSTDGTVRENYVQLSFGFTDGTNDRSVSNMIGDGYSITATARHFNESYCFTTGIADSLNTGDLSRYASFNSWITDGVRVNWTDSYASDQFTVTCVLIKGVSGATVGTLEPSATQNGTSSVSGRSYTPECAIFGGVGLDKDVATEALHAIFSLGVALKVDASTSDQRAWLFWDEDNVSDVDMGGLIDTGAVCGQVFNGTKSWTGEITAWASDGWTMTTRDGASGGDYVIYLDFDLNGAEADVIDIASPTFTGTQKESLSFQPSAFFGVMSNLSAQDTVTNSGDSFSIGIADTSNEYTQVIGDEDGASASNAINLSDQKVFENQDYDSGWSDFLEASVSSWDSDGITLNWTAVDTSARYGFALLIGASAAGTEITVTDLDSASDITDAALSAIRALALSDPSAATQITESALTAIRNLVASDPAAASEISDSILTAIRALDEADVSIASQVTACVVNTGRSLSAEAVNLATEIEAVVLGVIRYLSGADLSAATQVGTPSLSALRQVTVSGTSAESVVSTVVLSAVRELAVADLASESSVGAPTVAAGAETVSLLSVSSASQVATVALALIRAMTASAVASATQITEAIISAVRELGTSVVSGATTIDAVTVSVAGTAVGCVGAAFSAAVPGIGFAGKRPGIGFSGSKSHG